MKKLLFYVSSTLLINISAFGQITGTKNIPGDYASISAAFTALNLPGGVGLGGVTFNVAAGYTESVVGISLTTLTTTDANHFITFKKSGSGANPKITASGGAGAADAAISIIGSSYVKFDGIDIAVSTNKVEYGYYIQNNSATVGSHNDSIKNCQITLDKTNTNATYGIYQNSSIAPTSAAGANSNNVFYKVNIDNSFSGMFIVSQTSNPALNVDIDSCRIGTYAGSLGGSSGNGASWGIRCNLASGINIFGCEVAYINMSGTKNIGGIFLSGCNGSSNVYNNKVHDLNVPSGSRSATPIGIRVDENNLNTANVYNNMLWGFAHSFATDTIGILCQAIAVNVQLAYTGTVNVYDNTAVLSLLNAHPSCTVFSVAYGHANVKNNIFYNTSAYTSGSNRYCIYATSGTLTSSDNNDLYMLSGTNSFIGNYSGNKTALSDWQTATGKDANSISSTVTFVSPFVDLHLDPYSNCAIDGKGTPVSVTTDIDNDTRNASTPDIGADEFSSPAATISYPGSPFYTSVSTPQAVTLTGTTGGTYSASPSGLSIGFFNGSITPSSSTPNTYTVTYTIPASGTCSTITSTATVSITAAPTISTFSGTGNWNVGSYWDHGVPVSTTQAFINGNCTVTAAATCNNLTINPTAYLTVNSGQTLSITGQFTIKSTAGGTGSYINNGTVTYASTPKVERNISQNAWHYITSPVQGAVSGLWVSLYLKDYNESTNAFNALITSLTTPLTVGKGFALWSGTTTGNVTRTYTGNLNEGNLVIPLQWSGSTRGNNLIGNIFTSAISADIQNWTKTNVANSLWVWDQTAGNYLTWNGTGGSLTTGIIPASQSFLVKATAASANITIMQSKRVHSAVAYHKAEATNTLKIRVSGNSYSDQLDVVFNNAATNNYDAAYDIIKMYGLADAPQIATIWYGDTLSENVIPEITTYTIMPMLFECSVADTFTLAASGASTFNASLPIRIQDLYTSTITDLRLDTVYQFTHNPAITTPRFNLLFGTESAGIAEHNNSSISIFAYDRKIFINDPNLIGITQIAIYNIVGQLVKLITSLATATRTEINADFAVGAYIVKTIAANGNTVIKKIIIN